MNQKLLHIEAFSLPAFADALCTAAVAGYDLIDGLETVPMQIGERFTAIMQRGAGLPKLPEGFSTVREVDPADYGFKPEEDSPASPPAQAESETPPQTTPSTPPAPSGNQNTGGKKQGRHHKG